MDGCRKLALALAVLVISLGPTLLAQERLPYQDPRLPVEQRVSDLLKRMTLEEKIAQLEGSWQNRDNVKDPNALFVDEKGDFLPAQASLLL
jgi:beta-glucosidase